MCPSVAGPGCARFARIDDRIAGPFDEVFLERASLDAEQSGTFVFHSRTGREVRRHAWRF